jgi:hypothetical protein
MKGRTTPSRNSTCGQYPRPTAIIRADRSIPTVAALADVVRFSHEWGAPSLAAEIRSRRAMAGMTSSASRRHSEATVMPALAKLDRGRAECKALAEGAESKILMDRGRQQSAQTA